MERHRKAYLGGGCFWCLEAIFRNLKGVEKVVSGYSGGSVPGTPTYREVSSGKTGHKEIIALTFDPEIISFESLLFVFFSSHNPNTSQAQGFGYGSQYTSVIFYDDESQELSANAVIAELSPRFSIPILTLVRRFERFFPAEDYHQNYYEENKNDAYCTSIIEPQLKKIQKLYTDQLK
ncbi:peptide-methionine (S)-S-oxide reductase MsrA [Cellulophaga sp. Hel_I_12]|uniref:peptide-methionine (S)-S-oxide reductase MsrA n=1 Tax=Cellulophaga sp. Hel_I_12 TaxID=1249972 RepID=UPI00064675DD|nr:peptide-methionine (S)-S-oxide reductase MsrA [Cellulophaga sp. Hel_I_12]